MYLERAVLPDGTILELNLYEAMHYRLSVKKGNSVLLEYRGNGEQHRRAVRGRDGGYEFKSVEKLRYDFERDAEDAQRQG